MSMLFSAAWSPDGKRIVTASWDKTARVWNADGTGEPLVLRGHEDWVSTAAFSPDGERIVSGSQDKTVRIWSDLLPLRGVDDPRLWTATPYCMPFERRIALLNISEAVARAGHQACQRRVDAARGRTVAVAVALSRSRSHCRGRSRPRGLVVAVAVAPAAPAPTVEQRISAFYHVAGPVAQAPTAVARRSSPRDHRPFLAETAAIPGRDALDHSVEGRPMIFSGAARRPRVPARFTKRLHDFASLVRRCVGPGV